MTDLDVLHTEPLGDVAEQSTTVNREPEVLGIHVGCSQSGENHCGFTGGYRVSIQRDGPLTVRGLHLVSLPKAALNVVRTGFSAKLSPDCRSAWTEQFSQRVHSVSIIAHARSAATNAQVQQASPTERFGCSGRSGIFSSRPTSQRCGGSFWLGVFIRVVLREADRAGIAFSGGEANQILTGPLVG